MTPRYVLAAALAAVMMLASGAALADGDAKKGAKVFKKCKACHTIKVGGKHKIGPNLHGVIGRTAGTVEGFKFSNAMKNSGIVWDDNTLAEYLADPKGYVPKNKMAFKGLKKQKQRADVIAYVRQAGAK